MNIKQLTQKLISIPSYVDGDINEKALADYIFSFLSKKTSLVVEKEFVEDDRYNILAYFPNCKTSQNTFDVDILFIDHIDTVEPKLGSKHDQFVGIEEDGKLYGLGSADTKGNVAVLMKLAELIQDQKCMFLFYVDEEYHFKGIKQFIVDYKSRLKVKRIISADGENLQIRNASRGVFELDIVCVGKTGHSSNPSNGVNVISAFKGICSGLEKLLISKIDIQVGKPSMNVAYMQAGLYRGQEQGNPILGRNGNNIPDYLESKLEFRSNSKVSVEEIVSVLQSLARKENVNITICRSQNNLKPWYTPKSALGFIEKALRERDIAVKYTDPGITGYVDIGLLQSAFPSICCCIGTIGKNRHGVNEYVVIDSLYALFEILKDILHKDS